MRILVVAALFLVVACQSKKEDGQALFEQNCASCHNFRDKGIGPALGGIKVSDDSLKSFLQSPRGAMPSFKHLDDNKLEAIVAYVKSKPAPAKTEFKPDGTELKDPIPEKIELSNVVVDLKLFTTIPPSSKEGQKTRIIKLDYRPDTKDLFVLDLRGKLYQLTGKGAQVYLDMTKEMPKFIDQPGLATGFGSFAFHPEFAKNGLLYTTHTESPGSGNPTYAYADSIKVTLQWVLSEWNMNTKKHREIFRINMVSQIHGVQDITFDPLSKRSDKDYGLLYVGIGDGGAVENGYPFLVSKENPWGKVLTVDPSNDKVDIYASGFRNPHKISWTNKGLMMVANVGHGNLESLYIVEQGKNYGWPAREGSFELRYKQSMSYVYKPKNDSIYTYPVAEYDHDEGNAITGGYEYKGKYVFGDIVKGRVFFIDIKDVRVGGHATIKEVRLRLNGEIKTLSEITGEKKVDVRFGRDSEGQLYIMTKPDGQVYKAVIN